MPWKENLSLINNYGQHKMINKSNKNLEMLIHASLESDNLFNKKNLM